MGGQGKKGLGMGRRSGIQVSNWLRPVPLGLAEPKVTFLLP